MGERPFESRDRSGNVWWLAVLSMGESWHNLHHADPTCARHRRAAGPGRLRRPVIRWFETLGWAYDVRWPRQDRLDARRASRDAGGMMAVAIDEQPSSRARAHATSTRRDRRIRMTGKERREQLLDIGRIAVRREGLRRDLGRGDRRQGRASPSRSSTSTSAARRASTRSSSTAR